MRKLWRVLYPFGMHFAVMQGVAFLAMIIAMAAGIYRLPAQLAIPLTGAACFFLIPIGYYFLGRDNWMRPRPGLFLRMSGIDVFLALLLGVAYGQIGNQVIGALQLLEHFPKYYEQQTETMFGQPFWLLVLVVGILTPAAEEMLFRGLVYLRLKDYVRPWMAVALSALGFGMYHGNLPQFLYATFLGVIFALLYERTDSLFSCVLAHMSANIWSVILSRYGVRLLELGNGWVLGGIFLWLLVVGAVGVLYLFSPGKRV